MIRKLIVIFLSGLICLETITSVLAMEYKEAPMLRVKVAAGELPPVEERLPKNPVVVTPVEEIGQYGGTWHKVYAGSAPWMGLDSRFGYEPLVRFDRDGKTIVPNIAEKWEIKDGGKTFIFHLRKGIKWSDGVPYTVDDIMFWYEVMNNKELTPAFPGWLKQGGRPVKIEKIDDYTIRFSFAKPYLLFLENLTFQGSGITCYCKHYLKQFYPQYTSPKELGKKAKAGGFDFWFQMFTEKASVNWNPELPTIRAWRLQERGATRAKAIRNPYYWKVDPTGNQLPYIDYIVEDALGNAEAVNMKTMMGEVDFQGIYLDFQNYTLFMENSEKGNYRVLLWEIPYIVTIYINQNCKDPVLRKLFEDRKFRIALSLAIDRDSINEFCYQGVGIPHQATAGKSSLYYKEEFTKHYIEYDPQKANKLLDEIGLTKRDAEGYRLRPDGKTLAVVIEPYPGGIGASPSDVYELVKKYWEAVGVKTAIKTQSGSLWVQRVYRAGEHQIAAYVVVKDLWDLNPRFFVPVNAACPWAPLCGMWYESGGKSGEQPTGDIRKVLNFWEELVSAPNQEVRIQAGQNILALHDKNLWQIGLLAYPTPIVVKSYFRNVPEKAVYSWILRAPGYVYPEQFFIKSK
ncbi:ABC transporter substrate-binding protein [Candidatus Aerophobetes bacterium]|nr:ABC transporter substrate-binding protein [Candidatus Aerophobetes bacterium]